MVTGVELPSDSRDWAGGTLPIWLISLPGSLELIWIIPGQCAGPIAAGDGAKGIVWDSSVACVRLSFIYFSWLRVPDYCPRNRF